MNCPSATIGHVQNSQPPMATRPRKYRAKMPVDGEM
jgi:hypothetical protein